MNRAICPYSLFFGHTNEGWLPLSVFDYRDCILVITKESVPVIGVDATIHRPSGTPLAFVQVGASSMD